MGERPEAADHESGGNHEKDGKGNFGDDQDVAKALRDRACGAAAPGFEGFGESEAGGLKSGSETEGQAGRESEHNGKEKDTPVEMDIQ
jgi:hypothetical protein